MFSSSELEIGIKCKIPEISNQKEESQHCSCVQIKLYSFSNTKWEKVKSIANHFGHYAKCLSQNTRSATFWFKICPLTQKHRDGTKVIKFELLIAFLGGIVMVIFGKLLVC